MIPNESRNPIPKFFLLIITTKPQRTDKRLTTPIKLPTKPEHKFDLQISVSVNHIINARIQNNIDKINDSKNKIANKNNPIVFFVDTILGKLNLKLNLKI